MWPRKPRCSAVIDTSNGILLLSILVLTGVSAYFSGSETAMMSLNRYRLRHLVNSGHRSATKAHRLLMRPDRLLGVILIGNNLVNFIAASLATLVATRMLGEALGAVVAPVALTLFVLIFAEATPKTVAARRPEIIAFPSSYILAPLLRLFHPLVALINVISNALAEPMIRSAKNQSDDLSVEELKTVVNERAAIPRERQDMLLGILDLERVKVEDIMVPRSDIVGIDISNAPADIVAALSNAQHTRMPVFRNSMNNIIGVLHMRRAARLLLRSDFTRTDLLAELEEPYFVPEGTRLHTQLFNFQQRSQRIALVVDEYGDILGLATLEDILEEIVGEFTTDFANDLIDDEAQPDGAYLIDGKALLRDVNRVLGWKLPTAGPRTMNGLVMEHLELIPDSNVGMRIGSYLIETVQVVGNVVRTVKVREQPAAATADGESARAP